MRRLPGAARRARRLGGDHGLEVDEVEDARFDQLRFRHRRRDAQDGLVGEEERPFRHRVHLAREAPLRQPLREIPLEELRALDPVELFSAEAYRFKQLQGLGEPRGHQEVALRRELPDEELEDGDVGHLLLVVGLQHRQLVQVGEQGAGERVHPATVGAAGPMAFDAGQRPPDPAPADFRR